MLPPADILNRIAAVADEMKLANLQPQIAACRNQLHAGNGIDVAVFGRFKAGKSSFLNHLTGREVLPIGVVPLTAVITRLRFGSRERAKVLFLDGAAKDIPLGEIHLYVGENENPDNRKKVAAVEVELPELKPLAPLQFVDTPGLGSALAHNTEAALNWLPNVGAALVAVSSDAPLSERDLALLAELRRHTPKIVLLLTKADLLTEPQRAEVLEFVREQLRRQQSRAGILPARVGEADALLALARPPGRQDACPTLDAEVPLFFYSNRPGHEECRIELEQRLLFPLLKNRGETAGQILQHKLASLTSQTLNYVRVALAAATQAESARATLRDKLAEERHQFDLFREELRVLARQWSAKALDQSLARLEPTQEALQIKIANELETQFPQWQLRLPSFLKLWREQLQIFLARELTDISRAQQAMFREPLHKVRAHLNRTLRAFHDRLATHVQAVLGVTLSPREFSLQVSEPSAPPVDVGYVDAAFSLVSFAIPMTLFRRVVERVLVRKSLWEVRKNLSRLAADWRDRVTAGINELICQAEQQALDELGSLEQTLAQTPSNAPRLRQIIADLENDPPAATIQSVNDLTE